MIDRAIALAVEAGVSGNRPFGAVLVAATGKVLAEGRNEAGSTGDVTAHAELVAIRAAIAAGHGEQLAGSTVYASGEPCPMCAAACVWAGLARIVFAASTQAFSTVLPGGPQFGLSCADMVVGQAIEVCGPVREEQTVAAMALSWPSDPR